MQASQPQVTDDEAELLYEQELDKIAKTELDTDCLDEWFLPLEEAPRTAHHSEVGKLFTAAETARRILIDRESGVQAVCVVEGISLQWAIELGHALKLDPMFFVEHVRALDEGARIRSLVQARNPNTTGGLRSTFGDAGRPWCTLRGVVDHGHIREDCKDKPIACATKRLVDKSNANEYLSHTNVSVYRVHEFLCTYCRAACLREVLTLA